MSMVSSQLLPAAPPKPTEQIVQALKGDLILVVQEHISLLKDLSREAAYDAIMNDPELLDACFQLFRHRPDLFSEYVIGKDFEAVTQDGVMLRCGRTLGEAISLILQAAARRYFRYKLGQTRRVTVAPRSKPNFFDQTFILLGFKDPPKPIMRKVVGAGDRLFAAMRDYLRFDWQAALIPHYAPLTPELVHQLGPRILDVREPSELRALASREERAGMADGRPPLLLDNAKRLIKPTGDTMDSELLYKVCTQMDLVRLFNNRDANAMRKAIAQVAGTSPAAIEQLMPVLGADLRLFVSFFVVAYVVLGEDEYRHCFATDGSTQWMVRRFADHLTQMGELPPPSFDAIRAVFSEVLTTKHK